MSKLEIAKKVIRENFRDGNFGLFNSKNIMGDMMTTLYEDEGLTVDICYYWSYFEVFGLTRSEFCALGKYYNELCAREER